MPGVPCVPAVQCREARGLGDREPACLGIVCGRAAIGHQESTIARQSMHDMHAWVDATAT